MKRERERERVDLFEILGSDAGEIETEAAMEEKEKDCGDRGERRSKRHGVSFSERERERERERDNGSVSYGEKESEKVGLRG